MKAKTFMMLTGLLFFPGLKLYSQEFKFGFLAGIDLAKSYLTNQPDNSAISEYKSMISYNLNGYIEYKTAGIIGISVEPGFIQKGYIMKYQGSNVRYQLNYLQMPVLADIFITNKLYLSAGPEIAYLLNVKIKTINDKVDMTDIYERKFELAGIVGLNYKITKNFDVDLRYSRGFTNTMEINYTDENGHLIANLKEFNQYLQLIVRYKM